MKTIEYVGYSLMIVAYTIFLIKNLEFKVGLIISLSTIIVVFIVLKYLSITMKENDSENEELTDQSFEKTTQSVGNMATAEGDISYNGIKQIINK